MSIVNDVVAELWSLYADLNSEHFDGRLPEPDGERVTLVPCLPHEHEDLLPLVETWGLTQTHEIVLPGGREHLFGISLHSMLFDPNRPALYSAPVEGVLLHEMVHIAIVQKWGKRGSGCHGKRFTGECNRIGARRGWVEVVVADSIDDEEWNRSDDWPDNVTDVFDNEARK
jgi:hypothetical protein